jgi:hypothetical protein
MAASSASVFTGYPKELGAIKPAISPAPEVSNLSVSILDIMCYLY